MISGHGHHRGWKVGQAETPQRSGLLFAAAEQIAVLHDTKMMVSLGLGRGLLAE